MSKKNDILGLDLTTIFGDSVKGLKDEKEAAKKSKILWVVGRYQMSRYDPESEFDIQRKPRAPKISSLEAYKKFGITILAEATEYGAALL